jgi:hypothetical protein
VMTLWMGQRQRLEIRLGDIRDICGRLYASVNRSCSLETAFYVSYSWSAPNQPQPELLEYFVSDTGGDATLGRRA